MNERVEFGVHTNMDRYGGVDINELIPYVKNLGMNGVCITDYNSVSSFPRVYLESKKYEDFKVIYGAILLVFENDFEFPVKVIVRNEVGLRNLYKLVTLCKINNKKEYNKEVITKEQLVKHSEGLLIGYSINNVKLSLSEDFTDNQVQETMMFYDFIEVNPLSDNISDLEVQHLVEFAEEARKIIIATNDVYYLRKTDDRCYKVLSDDKSDRHFKSLEELREDFGFLEDYYLIERIILENTRRLASLVGNVDIFKDFDSSLLEDGFSFIKDEVFKKIDELYDGSVKKSIIERVNRELQIVVDNNNIQSFYIMKIISDYVKSLGYNIKLRGNVNGSMVMFLLGVSEIYEDSDSYIYLDLDKNIEACLEVPSVIYKDVINYLESIIGENSLFKAGIQQLYSEFRAKQLVDKYIDNKNLDLNEEDIKETINSLVKVRSQTVNHVACYFVIPNYLELPCENVNNSKVIHFDYSDINNYLFKINLLSSEEMSMLGKLSKITVDVNTIDIEDEEVFNSLGLGNNLGKIDLRVSHLIPKFKPKNFSELVKLFDVCFNKMDECIDITNREELYEHLISLGIQDKEAYRIMKDIILGKVKDEDMLKFKDVSLKFLEFCKSGYYLPSRYISKLHARNYVKLMYYKIRYPLEFYYVYICLNKDKIFCDEITLGIIDRKDRHDIINELSVLIDAKEQGISFKKSSDSEVHMDKKLMTIWF